jgi:release factor glutamine methyltransferase
MRLVTKDYWLREVHRVYELMRRRSGPYIWKSELLDIKLTVHQDVFSPAYFSDSEWFAKEVADIVSGNSFLDVGTGTGIIALYASLHGATVSATDANQKAFVNARDNFDLFGQEIQYCLGDVYEPLPEGSQFDYIFWNHPFNMSLDPVNDIVLQAGFDHEYQSLEKYVRGAKRHLTERGELLLGTSEFADLDEIERLTKRCCYALELLREERIYLSPFSTLEYTCYIFALRNKRK